jgi:ferredoxin
VPAEGALLSEMPREDDRSAGLGPELRPEREAPEAPGARVRGEGVLRAGERVYLLLDRLLGRALPDELNPFLHTGAVAITSLAAATASGVVLLLWYSPSVHGAYASLADLSRFGGGLVRSLHRYASDACMFFALVHALRIFLERRFTGAQWLAWVTGLAAVGLLWFVGWTGYWLVWDARAQHVAVGTARFLDALPIFVDPIGRAFLSDAGVNSLLFFVVFFTHMLVPLGLGIALWLHVARLARARFLTRLPLTLWICGSLLFVSLAWPATSAEPAHMTALAQRFELDPWYLLPLLVTERLAGGALWSIVLVAGALVTAAPWWLRVRRAAATRVEPARCNACTQCYQDCPYEAIAMVPRDDPRSRHALVAEVDASKCVGCGICSGSCDSVGIGFEEFSQADQRRRIEAWLHEAVAQDESPRLALVCAHSAGAGLAIDPETGCSPELPGFRLLEVPCAGWVHPLTLERALRRGGREAFVVSCPPGSCRFREGVEWTRARLEGERPPMLRTEKVERSRIHLLALDRNRVSELLRRLRGDGDGGGPRPPRRGAGWLEAGLLALLLAAGLGAANQLPYHTTPPRSSELVVTFTHPGAVGEHCHVLSEEEKAKLPPHMRRDQICERRRAPVRLRVRVDGQLRVQRAYPPSGLWGDGNSVAIERIPVSPGEHDVEVAIGDSHEEDEWSFETRSRERFTREARRVLAFDRVSGFTWH